MVLDPPYRHSKVPHEVFSQPREGAVFLPSANVIFELSIFLFPTLFKWEIMQIAARLDRAGRIMIPHRFRNSLGLSEGSELIVRLEDGELRLSTPLQALKQAQRALSLLKKPGESVVDDLLADRKQEAHRE